jgi:hypothetical protein
MAQRGMTDYNVSLSAGVPQSLNVDGDFFHAKEVPNAAGVLVRFDESKQSKYKQGVGARVYYSRVTLESVASQDIVVALGFGHVADARASVSANITANVTPGNLFDDGGDVAIAATATEQLLAADPDRLYALIKNPSTSTVTVRLGSAAVAAGTGIPVEPGETLPVAQRAAIYAYNPGAGSVTLSASAVKVS